MEVQEQDGGLQINGSWAFESGCTLASHVGGMVVLPPLSAGAPPRLTVALVPVAQARIVETWDPVGLGGTGSHDVHFDRVFVPYHRTFCWPAEAPVSDYPAAIFVPGTWFIANGAAATYLGLARRALDEARNELRGGRSPRQPRSAKRRSLACRSGRRSWLAASPGRCPGSASRNAGVASRRATRSRR